MSHVSSDASMTYVLVLIPLDSIRVLTIRYGAVYVQPNANFRHSPVRGKRTVQTRDERKRSVERLLKSEDGFHRSLRYGERIGKGGSTATASEDLHSTTCSSG